MAVVYSFILHDYSNHRRLKFGLSILLKYLQKILGSHFKEMDRCETSRFGAILCLVSSLQQRMLHSSVKMLDAIFRKMEEESTRVVGLELEGHILFISGQKLKFKC